MSFSQVENSQGQHVLNVLLVIDKMWEVGGYTYRRCTRVTSAHLDHLDHFDIYSSILDDPCGEVMFRGWEFVANAALLEVDE